MVEFVQYSETWVGRFFFEDCWSFFEDSSLAMRWALAFLVWDFVRFVRVRRFGLSDSGLKGLTLVGVGFEGVTLTLLRWSSDADTSQGFLPVWTRSRDGSQK